MGRQEAEVAINAPLDEEDTYLAWDSSIDSNANGDGVLIYPGRRNLLPSIRLANIRDGVEDGELLKMAASRDAAEAERFCRRFIRATDDFTRDPQLIRASRRSVLRFLLSDEASFITGVTLPVDGGFVSYSGV